MLIVTQFHGLTRYLGSPEASFQQNSFQNGRVVGHQTIYTEVDEPVHLGGFINRPDMHLQTKCMSTLDHQRINEAKALLINRNL